MCIAVFVRSCVQLLATGKPWPCTRNVKMQSMSKKIAILQSNYIPWKGYFDLIAAVDEFVLFDDMQYTRRDWRNRNQIKTAQGVQWLTVPVIVKGKYHQTIRDTAIDDSDWALTHWKSLSLNYRRAAHFDKIAAWLEPFYLGESYTSLSRLNRCFIEGICRYLNVGTTISASWDYAAAERDKTERLVEICMKAGATEYISGPSARSYLDASLFARHHIKLTWFDYDGYPEYPQLWGEFVHSVTILDLLFSCGKEAGKYMRYVRG